jgi:hypothetical protein
MIAQTLRPGSGNRDILANQGLIDGDRKVTAHLNPVFISLGPSTKG